MVVNHTREDPEDEMQPIDPPEMMDTASTISELHPILPMKDGEKHPMMARAYRPVINAMKAVPLTIKDMTTAIDLLETAVLQQNMPLMKECVRNVDRLLNRENVLTVFRKLGWFKRMKPTEFEPSAPPLVEDERLRDTDWSEDILENLCHNCLLLIDKEAEYVLQSPEFVELDYMEVYELLVRDSLEVQSEMSVYVAVYDWAMVRIEQRNLGPERMPEVLRKLRFTPRYCLMSRKEFHGKFYGVIKGPTKSGMLKPMDVQRIRYFLEEKSRGKKPQPPDQYQIRKRCPGKQIPNELSEISLQRHKELIASHKSKPSKKDTWIINFLTCWTAVFD